MPIPQNDNGIMCHKCFVAVNMTELAKHEKVEHENQYAANFMDDGRSFFMTCPYCRHRDLYDFADVKPMSYWKDETPALKAQIKTLESERDQAVSDAKRLAVLAHEKYPTEEFEEEETPSSVPPNSNEPKMEKKKDERPEYLH